MKGLLMKDFLSIKRQGFIYVFLAAMWAVMSAFNHDTSFFQGFAILLCSMMPITALAYDERAHFEKYALTMPLSREDLVLGKYFFGLICVGVALCLDIAFEFLHSIINHVPVSPELFLTLSVLLGVALLFLSFTMPIMFKFGTEKGRIIYMGLAVLIVLLPTLAKNASLVSIPFNETMLYFFPVIALVILWLSAQLSISIYRHKEFS